VGLSPAVLSRIERGRIVERRAVEKVATAMGVSLDRFPAGAAGDPDRGGG
jgi:transcriptional regulator with XRE-family HTH domain